MDTHHCIKEETRKSGHNADTVDRHNLVPCVDTFLEMWGQSECRQGQDKGTMLAPGIHGASLSSLVGLVI